MILGAEVLKLKDHQCTEPFAKSRLTFHAAKRHVSDLLDSDKVFAEKYEAYKHRLQEIIATEPALMSMDEFIANNSRESLSTTNGLYYHHDEVCYLLTLILKNTQNEKL